MKLYETILAPIHSKEIPLCHKRLYGTEMTLCGNATRLPTIIGGHPRYWIRGSSDKPCKVCNRVKPRPIEEENVALEAMFDKWYPDNVWRKEVLAHWRGLLPEEHPSFDSVAMDNLIDLFFNEVK